MIKMKKTKLTSFIKRIFIVLFVCYINTGCDKNELSLQGNLNMIFKNHPIDLTVTIYSLEDKSTPIYQLTPKWDGTLEVPLNVGNYLIKPNSTEQYYSEVGLQIMQDKATTVTYNEHNKATVNVN